MPEPHDRVLHIAALDEEIDRKLARVAGFQHGIVARRQLLVLGFTRNTVQVRIDRGQLHPIHRGVYAAGHRKLTLKAHWMAAVLACGPDALLSHRHALTLWEVRPSSSGAIDVTVPGRATKPGPRVVCVHSSLTLADQDRAQVDGIPVTSLARAILDYAATAGAQRTRLALEKAERMGFLIGRELDELLERNARHHGTRTLRVALAGLRGPAPWTQSELEDRFLALVRQAGLPEPEMNVLVEGELVDALWRDARLIVEVDGYHYHKSRAQFEADRRRDAKLQVAGYRVVRLTQQRIASEPRAVMAELLALLGL